MSLAEYATKGEFAKDIEKIIYSNAFRRLANKSQIIIKPTRDHFRSRLIHTEEVNRIALSIGKRLGLNLELISAIAMGHDIGHTPFGHAGERAIQTILEREIMVRFNIKPPSKAKEYENFKRQIFHHSLNSARILMKEEEFGDISKEVIFGILTHSWSPWKQDPFYKTPKNYEAQVVAVADQIASINHDTEDIIEGSPYTEYDLERFRTDLINGFKKSFPESYKILKDVVLNFVVDKNIEPGYGRQRRVELIVSEIVKNTQKMIQQNNIKQNSQAERYPLTLSTHWSRFLWYYEKFIRDLIQEKVSWFIGRDNMAGALISTVFNYLWPRARTSGTVTQMKIPMFKHKEIVKSKIVEKTKYIDHFIDFFNDHYFNEKNNTDYYKTFLSRLNKANIPTWDRNILSMFKRKPSPEEYRLFSRLIAVIDFIAGLTDRYCLEIFDEVYHEFVIT